VNPADRQTLARKFKYLRQQLERLEGYRALTREAIMADFEKRSTVERLLELSIQSVIDCSRLLVALRDLQPLRDERYALLVLAERGIITEDLAGKMLQAKGFRNILVHEYVEIDPTLLYAHLTEDTDDLWEFAAALAEFLKDRA
jgi:uncharacterized protein YutE (UPF0331/DUF86 family)